MSDLIERLRNLDEDPNGLIHGMPRENTVYHEAADRIEQLEQERDALAAHVERMIAAITPEPKGSPDYWYNLTSVALQVPRKSLAERDADALECAIDRMKNCYDWEWQNVSSIEVFALIEQHANKLREKGDDS